MKPPGSIGARSVPLLALFCLANLLQAQAVPPSGRLQVRVEGLKAGTGDLVVKVFRKEDDLFGPPWRERTMPATHSVTTVEFADLLCSTYTVFAFQDLNRNGTLDHNWMHLPGEPLGWSNQWRFGLFTGMPTFEKTKFSFSQQHLKIVISLR